MSEKRVVHILGNGDSAHMMPENMRFERDGKLIVCNMPPFEVDNVWGTVIVDFKMMMALHEGSVVLDRYKWILGNRPKLWMDANPTMYIQRSAQIREFYTHVPKYCKLKPEETQENMSTNFNCGHMATHYSAKKLKATEIHMYGFDSIFDHNMRSYTDTVLQSDRGNINNHRLLHNWRPIWKGIFNEFKAVQFHIYHKHAQSKVNLPDNVNVVLPK